MSISSSIVSDLDKKRSSKKGKKDSSKRITVSLPAETVEMLEILASLQSVSQSEAIRRAISTEAFIQHEIHNGSQVFVKTTDNIQRELVFR